MRYSRIEYKSSGIEARVKKLAMVEAFNAVFLVKAVINALV